MLRMESSMLRHHCEVGMVSRALLLGGTLSHPPLDLIGLKLAPRKQLVMVPLQGASLLLLTLMQPQPLNKCTTAAATTSVLMVPDRGASVAI